MVETLKYPYKNFYEMLVHNADTNPHKKVILVDDLNISNKELLAKVDAFAYFLDALGTKDGDMIPIIAPNCYEFIVSVFAICKLGAVAVPLNNMLKQDEYRYILNDCSAKFLITSDKFKKEISGLREITGLDKIIWIDDAPALDEYNILFSDMQDGLSQSSVLPANKNLDELAVIFYTSGTTGNPKGAMLSYRNIFSNMISGSMLFKVTTKDRFIVYLPMFHAFTFTIMTMLPIFTNSSILIIKKLHPFSNILKQTLLKRVTVFLGVPDVYNALIRAKLPWYFLWFNSIRLFISGASALSEDTLNKYTRVFKRAKMLEGYGLSECSPGVSVNTLEHQRPYSIGKPLPGYEVKIVNEDMVEVPRGETGEIIVHGDCVMMGYLNNEEKTKETICNGWLKTGDMGKMDEDGFIYIVDRIKDLIISKGINIYPRQIEEALTHLPYIKTSAVVGKKDSKNGEVPVAFVELEDNVDRKSITQLRVKNDLKDKLANFKIPRAVHFVDNLPKTATGKVLKRVLKEQIKEEEQI